MTYEAPPVAISRPVSFSRRICTEAMTAEPGEPARRGKGAADALVQVVGPQVDGADAAKALDDQITAFVGVFLGDVDTP